MSALVNLGYESDMRAAMMYQALCLDVSVAPRDMLMTMSLRQVWLKGVIVGISPTWADTLHVNTM